MSIQPDRSVDGGDLDCGSGLLLIIRDAMAPLANGGVLEVKSREKSVAEDLPAWCRMVGHVFLGAEPGEGRSTRYLVQKRAADLELGGDLEKARSHAWQVRVRSEPGLEARVFARNHSFTVGQPASFDTEDRAPSALEHLLGALGACLAVGLRWRASRRNVEIHNLELSLKARPEDVLVFLGVAEQGNPGLAQIEGTAYVQSDAPDEVLEEIWEETLRRSPVAQTLLRSTRIHLERRSVG